MMLTQTSRLTIMLGVVLIGIVILTAVVALPSALSILDLTTRIAEERAKTEALVNRALKFRKTSQTIGEIKSNLQLLEAMTIKKGHEVDFFSLLETKNRTYNLDQVIRLGEPTQSSFGMEKIPLEFQLRGTFTNILQYLSDLERSPIAITINRLELRINPQPLSLQQKIAGTFNGIIYVSEK